MIFFLLSLFCFCWTNFIVRPTFHDPDCTEFINENGREYYLENNCIPDGKDDSIIEVNLVNEEVFFKYCDPNTNCKQCDYNSTESFDECLDQGVGAIRYEYLESWPLGNEYTASYIFKTVEECREMNPKNVKRGTIYIDFCNNPFGVKTSSVVKCYDGDVYTYHFNNTDCTEPVESKEKKKKNDCVKVDGGYSIFRCASFMDIKV